MTDMTDEKALAEVKDLLASIRQDWPSDARPHGKSLSRVLELAIQGIELRKGLKHDPPQTGHAKKRIGHD